MFEILDRKSYTVDKLSILLFYSLAKHFFFLGCIKFTVLLLGLVAGGVKIVENTGAEGTDERSSDVGVGISIESVLLSQVKDRVDSQSGAYSWVEARTEFVRSGNAAEESEDNAHSGTDSNAGISSVFALDHQDDADEDESAHNLVSEYIDVHLETELSIGIIDRTSKGVSWGKDGDDGVISTELSKVSEEGTETTSQELGDHDHKHEDEVLSLILESAPDTKSDGWVEVTSSNISPNNYRG